jgi:acid stress-induced BolA-like protein IbaG/YrbA
LIWRFQRLADLLKLSGPAHHFPHAVVEQEFAVRPGMKTARTVYTSLTYAMPPEAR